MVSENPVTEKLREHDQRIHTLIEWKHRDLAQWQQEVSHLLGGIQKHLVSQDESAARIERAVGEVSHLVTGNGTPERGVIVRLDRVENVVSELRSAIRTTIAWFLRPAAGAVGLAGVSAAVYWIMRNGLNR
ncbi:MAG: hypothetical protein JO353_12905 [Phycisphaerae bacterium]|nr:hypothetical protein [Phycisphaerae bacterium]